MHVHACGSLCSRHPAHLTRSMVTICMPKSLALYPPERSTTAHTHLTVHMPCCIGSTIAAAWCAAPWHRCGMHNRDTWSQCGGVAPAWVMAEGTRPMC